MGRKKEFTVEEIKQLEEALEVTSNKVEIKRILAVKAKAELGLSNEVIGTLLNYSEHTVRDIISLYGSKGLAGLMLQNTRGGRKRENMTIAQEKDLLSYFSDHADNGNVATAAKIKEEYERRINRRIHKSTVSRLLKRHGWRKILPRQYHPKKDIEAQDAFKKTSDQLSKSMKKHWVKSH